jgi:hypothetical protein
MCLKIEEEVNAPAGLSSSAVAYITVEESESSFYHSKYGTWENYPIAYVSLYSGKIDVEEACDALDCEMVFRCDNSIPMIY